ncbi:MAG TPA: hypothetical protein VLU38_04245 [Methanomassiliicoccales archaeon]|nr:hypothetical protein [Methanomassiliicoccales archaeon]
MTGCKRASRTVLIASIMAIFVASSLGSHGALATAPTETFEIGFDGSAVLAHFVAGDLARVDFVFNVTAGGAIDLLLLDASAYEGYRLGANVSGLTGSVLNQSQGSGTITDLGSGQEYYIVMDNTGVPDGGASPIGGVDVECGISGSNITEVTDNSSWVPILLVLAFVVFLVIIYLLARSKVAEKEPGAKAVSLGMKYCPNCGEIVATWVHKCPKCGHEW